MANKEYFFKVRFANLIVNLPKAKLNNKVQQNKDKFDHKEFFPDLLTCTASGTQKVIQDLVQKKASTDFYC